MKNSFVKYLLSMKKNIKKIFFEKHTKYHFHHKADPKYDVDYETPCAQTIAEQAYLLSSLCKEARDKDNEIEILTFLKKFFIENGLNNNELITIMNHFNSDDIKSFLSDKYISYLNMPELSHTMDWNHLLLDKIMGSTEHLVLTNPHIANLVLMRPKIIKALSQKIKQSFIFPAYQNPKKFFIEWGSTFSDIEYDQKHYWRWALSTAESHTITLVNNTPNIQNIRLRFSIRTQKSETAVFQIYFLNHKSCYLESHQSKIDFHCLLPPGRHRLKLTYSGEHPDPVVDDVRALHFAITDLSIRSDSEVFEKKQVYCQPSLNYFNPVNDRMVRSLLHESGFFEVSAMTQSFVSDQSQRLPVTRFHLVNQFYYYEQNQSDATDADVIWYLAKRCPTFAGE
jgi:hypothetical protein